MRGVVFKGDRVVEIQDFDDPAPGRDEVVLEIKASGMCGSDLHFYRAPAGQALAAFGLTGDDAGIIGGHEPCGVVAAVGADVDPRAVRVGDRMMVHHYDGCGFCDQCRTGWPQLCERGNVIYGATAHGGHADFLKVPARTLVPLPDELSFAAGAAISCGTGTAFGALRRLRVDAGDSIAVFGQGPVGQSAVQLAAAMGARVIAVDIERARVERATEFGAADTVDSSTADPVEAIRELTGGKGVTKALDCSGAPPARAAAVKSAAKWGTVAFVGEGSNVTLDVSPDLIRKQLTVLGSYTFSLVGQADCARFVAAHGVEVDRVFTDRWRLDDAVKAYEAFDRQTGGKAVIEF
ncbi:zinc-dependent alcohol dehydrogenase family protein [Amycolatopsis regifaucium]|uniref:Iditol 2-dehydrogenase n=1 Tax=Amycolatopsis regifaucium TaxID=546365 RepID=A0A154MG03_9PSEU|nr:zinc-binding dehydrogenase [Amycolatopsis regifaucium]KZB83133.1 iditol 2-dehydrogenase [Amycolatopsis regifaucium]OKA03212.1 iditol 2-dehydrogenase [Amycolatopsis regifaucium]SFJ46956.1 D-arabinose 1-dehydrogenase, Zn-dependent alcohol dehydrogenase family [Amycolatopsis regifaucium]